MTPACDWLDLDKTLLFEEEIKIDIGPTLCKCYTNVFVSAGTLLQYDLNPTRSERSTNIAVISDNRIWRWPNTTTEVVQCLYKLILLLRIELIVTKLAHEICRKVVIIIESFFVLKQSKTQWLNNSYN